jgi:CheY-like chemotaxis protein
MEQDKVILIADDDLTNRKLIRVFLKGLPFNIVEAADASQALAYLSENNVDLALVDISMPGMNGIELCQTIRSDSRRTGLPIIAYTAQAMSHEKEALLKKGFNELLIKPISREQLLSTIKKY